MSGQIYSETGNSKLFVGEFLFEVETPLPMFFKLVRLFGLSSGVGIVICLLPVGSQSVSLPPPEDTPEEVLRTEIITEARSPIDGKPLTAAEYAELQAELQARDVTPPLNPKLRQNVSLLRLRQLIRTVLPFLPI